MRLHRTIGKAAIAVALSALAIVLASCGGAGNSAEAQLVLEQEGTPIPNGGTFDFTDDASAGNPVDRTFTIRNTGDASLSLNGATPVAVISGDPEFGVLTQPSLEALDPGNTRDFVLRLTYDSDSGPGSKSASISVSTDDPDLGSFSFTVTGSTVS
jgi:hypothetical protein